MKLIRFIGLTAVFATAVGCGNKAAVEGPKANEVSPPLADGGVDRSPALPESLKNAAWDYMGLGEDRLMTYAVRLSKDAMLTDGTQTNELESVVDGVAKYSVSRTGGLAALGMDTVELTNAGASTTESSRGQIEEASLEVPADLAVGKRWESKTALTSQGTKTVLVAQNAATREESVTVEAGTFDCIVVESKITATVSGSPVSSENGRSTSTTVAYYSKGVGLVKLAGKGKRADGSAAEFSMELKKIG